VARYLQQRLRDTRKPDMPDAPIDRGHAGLRRYAEEIRERWEELSLEVHEVLMRGDVAVTIGLHRGRMRRTGIEFSHQHASVSEFSGGKVTRQRVYHDRAAALRAAGFEAKG
jgi:ketosteroid isomerase-like protein